MAQNSRNILGYVWQNKGMEINTSMVKEVLTDGLLHALAMAPVLFLVFMLMEAISHGARFKAMSSALRHVVAGPIVAAGLGLLPQCGFSVASTVLYVEGLIPTGSLLACYIATSDEAIPILVANPSTLRWVVPILGIKLVLGSLIGVLVNGFGRVLGAEGTGDHAPIPATDHDHTHVHGGSCVGENASIRDYIPHAFQRTARTVAMVFVLTVLMEAGGAFLKERIPGALNASAAWQPLAASLIGLIPSCATSVALAEGFRTHLISFPALLAGLTANSGMGLMVLIQESKNKAKTASVLALLVASACIAGLVGQLLQ